MNKKEKKTNGFLITYEILLFMQWLEQHYPNILNKIVKKACDEGFVDYFHSQYSTISIEKAYHAFITLFSSLNNVIVQKIGVHNTEGSSDSFRNLSDEMLQNMPCIKFMSDNNNFHKPAIIYHEPLENINLQEIEYESDVSFAHALKSLYYSSRSSKKISIKNNKTLLKKALDKWMPNKNVVIN